MHTHIHIHMQHAHIRLLHVKEQNRRKTQKERQNGARKRKSIIWCFGHACFFVGFCFFFYIFVPPKNCGPESRTRNWSRVIAIIFRVSVCVRASVPVNYFIQLTCDGLFVNYDSGSGWRGVRELFTHSGGLKQFENTFVRLEMVVAEMCREKQTKQQTPTFGLITQRQHQYKRSQCEVLSDGASIRSGFYEDFSGPGWFTCLLGQNQSFLPILCQVPPELCQKFAHQTNRLHTHTRTHRRGSGAGRGARHRAPPRGSS